MNAALDITKEQRKTLLELLREFIPGVLVWAYGSRVKWTARPNSDLDIVVFTTHAQKPLVSELKDALAESDLPFLVDIHIWDEIPERFHSIIRNEYVVLQQVEEIPPRNDAPGEWKEKTLGELTENFDGQRVPVKESERKPGIFPYYGASGIVDRVDKYIFDGEYLLVAEDGENLRSQKTPVAFLARGKFWVNNHAHVVTGNAQSDTRFLMYALNNADIHGYLTGSTMPKLTQGNMNRVPILAPPPDEQRAIASVLGALDDKIEFNRRMNKTLEALAQTIFKSWFVDAATTKFPKGRRKGTLGEVTENPRRGIQPDEIKSSTPYIGLEHMPRRCIALSDWGHADELQSNKFQFERGEILFGKLRPYFHKVGVAPVDGVCSTDVLVVRPKTPEWFGFVLGHVSSVELVNHTNAASTGTKMPRGNWSDIARFEVALPPDSLAAEYTDLIRPMISRIIANILESRTLAELRDALLPKLLSGELRTTKQGSDNL
jgi:type I restriction enzyme S subunit